MDKNIARNSLTLGSINDLEHCPHQLKIAMNYLYKTIGATVAKAAPEPEGHEYGACRFELEKKDMVFRIAKTTPIKTGQFVTLWKRENRVTVPLASSDNVDCVIIFVEDDHKQGLFIFNMKILIEKEIVSHNDKRGKTGFRLYPPWTKPAAKQAITTQNWQLNYFFSLGGQINIDRARILELLKI